MGKGKGDSHVAAQEHRSRPLASLKDPSSFGPPPKNARYHGGGGATVSQDNASDANGSVAPSSSSHVEEPREARFEEAAATGRKGPPLPYRADCTGLSTTNFPKPPVRYTETQSSSGPIPSATPAPRPKPPLPPRLPPRQNPPPSSQDVLSDAPPPYSKNPSRVDDTRESFVNQGALRRLGSTGIQVPELGIGGTSPTPNSTQARNNNHDQPPPSPRTEPQGPSQLQALQTRFANLSTTQSPPDTPAPAMKPNQGTSLAQKQAALKTANSFRNDPTSVSISDAKATAATAHNFRERHGEQVAAGWKTGSALNKKFDIAGKLSEREREREREREHVGMGNEPTTSNTPQPSSSPFSSPVRGIVSSGGRTPVVPKKSVMGVDGGGNQGEGGSKAPPVIPWGSKPRS